MFYSVDCLTFCSTILLIAEPEISNLTLRLEALFALIDYSRANTITPDELVVLLLSIARAISSILSPMEVPSDKEKEARSVAVCEQAARVNKSRCRSPDSPITRQEFVQYFTDYLRTNLGESYTLNDVLMLMYKQSPVEVQQ